MFVPDRTATRSTRDLVAELLGEGLTRADVARRLGITKSTVTYHARVLRLDIDGRCARRYDWAAVQAYYDEGHGVNACARHFGFARTTFMAAAARGDLRTRPRAMPIDDLLAGRRNRTHVKLRLIRAGLKESRCEECGISKWRGRPLSMALHHVNGDGHDNRLENLELLCPNCHSQTDNYGGRNRGRSEHGASPAANGSRPN